MNTEAKPQTHAWARVNLSPTFVRGLLPTLLVALLTTLLFLPAVANDFVDWDDPIMLRDNPLLREVSWSSVVEVWTKPVLGLYTPLSYTLWLFVAGVNRIATGHLTPALFHALNIALHATCAALVFTLLDQLFQLRWPAFIGALLFALHPLQVEPVAWIAGMNNLLAALWSLAALNLYIRGIRNPSRTAFAASVLCATLAMLSKPTAVVLPILAIVLHHFFFRAPWREITKRVVPWCVVTIIFILIGSFAQPAPGIDRPALWHRPVIAGDALSFYIAKLLTPVRLNIDYGRSPSFVLAQTSTFVAWVVPLACLLFAIVKRRHVWFLAGVLIFLLAPLPMLGLLPFDFQHFSTVADRYAYLGMVGPAIILAGIAQRSSRSALTALAIPLLLIIPTELQIRVWKNDDTLLTRAIALNPRSVAANRTLGYLAAQKGEFDEAEVRYQVTLNVRPADPLTHHNYASLLNTRGNAIEPSNPAAAELYYRRAIEMDSAAAAPHSNLAHLLESRGDMDGARAEYDQALRLDPDLAPAKRGVARLNTPSSSPVH